MSFSVENDLHDAHLNEETVFSKRLLIKERPGEMNVEEVFD
jgi:hypothetical protein